MSSGVLLLAAVAALTVLAPGPAQAAPSGGGYCTMWLEEVQRHNEEHKHKDVNKTNTNYEDYKYEMIPDCDEHGNFKAKQCHSFSEGDQWCQPEGGCYHYSDGETWCVCVDVMFGHMDEMTLTQGGEGLHCDEDHRVPIKCHEWQEKMQYDNKHGKHEMVPECDEDGNFEPKQCHVFTMDDEWCQPSGSCFRFKDGDRWCGCVDYLTGEPDMATITKGGDDLHCGDDHIEHGLCHEWNEKIRQHDEYGKHEVVLDCDEHGNFVPKQCHVFVKDEEYCDPGEHCYHFREGDRWCICIHPTSGDIDKSSITKGGDDLHCDQYGHQISDGAGKPCCPEHWTHFGEHGHEHCFRFIDSKKTWVEAESYCRFEGGRLASIHCEETNRFLQGLTRGDTHEFPPSWVGGHNTVQGCFWMWSDGQIFDYENWEKDENKNREHSCLRINSGCNSNQLKWSSGCCNETLPFVCALEAECGHHW